MRRRTSPSCAGPRTGPRPGEVTGSPGERGVAGLEALAFGALIFVVGTLLIVNAWGVVDAKMATAAAAREATRLLAESYVETAPGAVEEVARETLRGHGRDPERMEGVPQVVGVLERCTRVEVTVAYRVPTITLPWIGGFGGHGVIVRSSHSELVDPFRSGLPGEARCDV